MQKLLPQKLRYTRVQVECWHGRSVCGGDGGGDGELSLMADCGLFGFVVDRRVPQPATPVSVTGHDELGTVLACYRRSRETFPNATRRCTGSLPGRGRAKRVLCPSRWRASLSLFPPRAPTSRAVLELVLAHPDQALVKLALQNRNRVPRAQRLDATSRPLSLTSSFVPDIRTLLTDARLGGRVHRAPCSARRRCVRSLRAFQSTVSTSS